MTETAREQIKKDEARYEEIMPGRHPSRMQQAWIAGDLIPRDEHDAAIAAAERRGMERAAVICDELVATIRAELIIDKQPR